ncbi:MAG: hypothetical protein M1837_002053 [Sclerophora amabilis]|nr:MAG: hypothetical protein M1837_002053 [Sclerophora amabilis]
MATRMTRSAAAKEAVFLAPAGKGKREGHLQLSSPPATPIREKKAALLSNSAKAKLQSRAAKQTPVSKTPTSGRKRKGRSSMKVEEDINELPHNLGKHVVPVQSKIKEEQNLSEKPINKAGKEDKAIQPDNGAVNGTPVANPGGKQPPKKGTRAPGASKKKLDEALNDPATKAAAQKLSTDMKGDLDDESPRKRKKAKADKYGLTPGETPFPDWPHPTPEECQQVNDLLSGMHGAVAAPAVIPPPSITVSGCGEVPSVLDALIRTLLSAATTGANSSRAFKGLVDTFGLLEEGIGKGSVNWNKVRLADTREVFEAIKSGGLADNKSKYIKQILDKVYEENEARRDAFVQRSEAANPRGSENETANQRKLEISKANQHVLSLDHLHALPNEEAFNILTSYPGIGPKTASCVLLFCLQRPSFAVDTHVWRLCKYLDWVPPTANRNATYSHCEVRVPDNLKYPLHQLMIRHGKTCPRCRAATGVGSEDWAKGCPIDHLVTRREKKKGGYGGIVKKKTSKSKKNKKEEDRDELTEEEEELDESDEALEETGDEADDFTP